MTDSVTIFCRRHEVQLPHKTADDFRLLQPGTYSHKTFPFGTSRYGITNGVVAYIFFDVVGLKYVEHSNLNIKFDTKKVFKMTKPKQPRTATERRVKKLSEIYSYVV